MKISLYITVILIIALLTFALFASRKSLTNEAQVKRGDITSVVAAKGAVEALQEADLAPKSLGRIREILVEEGDFVEKGEIIAILENDEIKAQVEQARANLLKTQVELKDAQQNLQRSRMVFQKGIISKSDLDSAQLRYDVAFAQLKREEADLEHSKAIFENTYVRAPFAGEITRRFLEPGETVTLERLLPIVTISDVSKIIVRAEIDETNISKLEIGQKAVISSDAYPGEEFRGEVVEISPAVGKKKLISDNPAEMVDRDVLEIKIELDPSAKKLNLGLQVDVTIFVYDRSGVLVLPRKAIEELNGTSTVNLKQNGNYQKRKIKTGGYNDEKIEIVDGLKEGDIVVLPNSNSSSGLNSMFPLIPSSR